MFYVDPETTSSSSYEGGVVEKPSWKISNYARRASFVLKFQDLYGFTVEGNVDHLNVLNDVRERVRRQARVWWAMEASKGANWYLLHHHHGYDQHDQHHGHHDQRRRRLYNLPALAHSIRNSIALKKLIRQGVPPNLRPKLWLSISGASKKRSTVPDTYYRDLIHAVDGKVTPATLHIDNVRTLPPSLSSISVILFPLFLK